MAIEFSKQLNQDNLLLAFNNNIIRFNSTEADSINAEIIGLGFPIILYPNPEGSFYFNFKEYSSVLANVDNFKDDLILIESVWFYDWTDKIYFPLEVEVKINFADDIFETTTIDTKFLSAYSQIDEIDFVVKNTVRILSPTTKLKLWKGYPFDITLFNTLNPSNIEIYDSQLGLGIQVATEDVVTRMFISNGNATQSVFDSLGLVEFFLGIGRGRRSFSIETINPNCNQNIYLKWINRFGGWNYWLFRKGRKIIDPKAIGELNNDFNDVEDTISQTISMGFTSQSSIFIQEDVHDDYIKMFTDLAESAKVYLFKGKPNQVSTPKDWIEVTLKDRAIKIQDAKRDFNNISFEIELPKRATRTL